MNECTHACTHACTNQRAGESLATKAGYLTGVGGTWEAHSYQQKTLRVTHVPGDTFASPCGVRRGRRRRGAGRTAVPTPPSTPTRWSLGKQEASFLLQLPAARSLVNKCGHPGKEGRLAAALVTARYGPHPGGGATSPTFLSCPSFF